MRRVLGPVAVALLTPSVLSPATSVFVTATDIVSLIAGSGRDADVAGRRGAGRIGELIIAADIDAVPAYHRFVRMRRPVGGQVWPEPASAGAETAGTDVTGQAYSLMRIPPS